MRIWACAEREELRRELNLRVSIACVCVCLCVACAEREELRRELKLREANYTVAKEKFDKLDKEYKEYAEKHKQVHIFKSTPCNNNNNKNKSTPYCGFVY